MCADGPSHPGAGPIHNAKSQGGQTKGFPAGKNTKYNFPSYMHKIVDLLFEFYFSQTHTVLSPIPPQNIRSSLANISLPPLPSISCISLL